MTKLYGFQCDECKVKSRDKPGRWIEVSSLMVNRDDEWSRVNMRSDGLHYCSRECLSAAIEKWPKS